MLQDASQRALVDSKGAGLGQATWPGNVNDRLQQTCFQEQTGLPRTLNPTTWVLLVPLEKLACFCLALAHGLDTSVHRSQLTLTGCLTNPMGQKCLKLLSVLSSALEIASLLQPASLPDLQPQIAWIQALP